jgi:hypothetical protein
MRVIIDVDSTLWDFATTLYYEITKEVPVFPTPDKWDKWAFYKGYLTDSKFYEIVDCVHSNQLNYPPFMTAKLMLETIRRRADIVIATHRNQKHKVALLEWLDKYQLPYNELHVSKDKTVLFNDVDLVIDDYAETLKKARDSGVIGIGLRYPWNDKQGLTLFDTQLEMISWLRKFLG